MNSSAPAPTLRGRRLVNILNAIRKGATCVDLEAAEHRIDGVLHGDGPAAQAEEPLVTSSRWSAARYRRTACHQDGRIKLKLSKVNGFPRPSR